MAKTTPTTSFKIWKVPEDADGGRTLAHGNPETAKWRSRVNEHPVGCSTEKQAPKMTIFPRRCASKETPAAENPKKTPENLKIPADSPKAPLKPRRAAKKLDGVPKRLEFPEAEDENGESNDSGFVATQQSVTHRYPTRAKVSGRATQKRDENPPKIANSRAAKPKGNSNRRDFDKENDASAANSAQPRQGSSLNKKRTGLPVNRPRSQNLATPDVVDLNSIEKQLPECSTGADWIEYMRWLQQQRDIGLWIECCRKGCGKWRYVEEYHDPLDVPKEWFCEMNTDARFADCSIQEAEIPEAESANQIENAYNAGSIVWAKIDGYPWWPAMVDECPQLLRYFDIRGSSIVPYKYHVKFFNERKIAWVLVRGLKPYAENPRSDFLKKKKMVFRRKDYTEEVNAACELTDQALSLPLRQRLEKFSWAALHSSNAREGEVDLRTKKVPPKKKISTRKSTDDANNRPAKKKMTRIANETVSKGETINVRSRIINVETDSVVNSELPSPQSSFSMSVTVQRRRTASGSKSPGTEPATSESWTRKRLYNIGGRTLDKSDVEAMSRRNLINLMCGYQDQSLSEALRTSRPDDANGATRFGFGSETNVFAGTEGPTASPWKPIEIDLTDDSTDDEYSDTQETSSSSILRNSESHGERFGNESNENIAAGTAEPSASIRDPMLIDITDADYPNCSEWQSFSGLSDLTIASTSNELEKSSPAIRSSSQLEQDELDTQALTSPNLSVGFGGSSVSMHLLLADISPLRMASWESEEAHSFRRHSESFGSGSKENISAGTVEPSASSTEPILSDLTEPCMDYQGHYNRQEYLDHPSRLESRGNYNVPNLTLTSASNEFRFSDIVRRFRSWDSDTSSESIVPSSQPEQDELYERLPKFPGLYLEFNHPSVSVNPSPVETDRYWPAHSSSQNLIKEITIYD